ncbi:hypothetical protein CFSAN002368_02752 [Clostridium botulinum A1 str. CFSAN002368]|nr:hypothetical protein CFSAN002368_02752 [Clostridium botulinum A1 str. CFSAN002368]
MENLGAIKGCPTPIFSLVSILLITAPASISEPVAASVNILPIGNALFILTFLITISQGSPS